MLIIYFLLGLGLATAHSAYGVSFRAQNFDKTVQSIDKEAYLNHQRVKRLITGIFVPQNVTNLPSWGSNIDRGLVAYITRFQYENRPSGYNGVIPNTDTEEAPNSQREKRFVTGFFVPQNVTNKPTWGNVTITRASNNITNVWYNGTRPDFAVYTEPPGYVKPLQKTNVTRPVDPNDIIVRNRNNTFGYTIVPVNPSTPGHSQYPGYSATGPVYPQNNNIIVRPAKNNNVSNSNPNSGFNVKPVNPVTPGYTPYYPIPNTGYPVPNTGYPTPNNWYPAPNTVYPAPNTGYPVPNAGYPASNTGYPTPNNWYPVPNTVYPAPNTGYPSPNTGYPSPNNWYPTPNITGFMPKPNPGFTITNLVNRNNSTGFNNTASFANCKCKLPRENSNITKEETFMDACIITCNNCPAGMKMSAFGVCVKDLDYDDE